MRKIKQLIILLIIYSASFIITASEKLPEPPAGILKLSPFPVPNMQLQDIDGEAFNIKETKDHWVFVHFWASWCSPCRKEMPAIQKMYKKLEKQGLKIALINTAEDEDTIFNFIGIYAPDIRALMDNDGQITEKWKPRGLPATYIVDRKGVVQYQALGGRPWDNQAHINFLLKLIQHN